MRPKIFAAVGIVLIALGAVGTGQAQNTTITTMRLANPVQLTLEGNPRRVGANTRFTVKAVISNASTHFVSAVKRAISVRTNTTRQFWLSSKALEVNGNEVVVDNRIRLETWYSRKVLSRTIQKKKGEKFLNVSFRLHPGIARGKLAIISSNHRNAPNNVVLRQVVWTPREDMLDPKLFKRLSPKVRGFSKPLLQSGKVTFTISLEVDGQQSKATLQNLIRQ